MNHVDSKALMDDSAAPSLAPPEDVYLAEGAPEPAQTSRYSVREAALQPGPTRDLLYEEHPLVRNAVMVPTLPVQESYAVVEQVIIHRESGTCFVADFRVGKTTALDVIAKELHATFPTLPVIRLIGRSHEPVTERGFYTDLLIDFKLGSAKTGTAADKRVRVYTAVLGECKLKKSNRALLLVDEGQCWGELALTYLRDLCNDWHRDGIAVITIMFGHPQLRSVRQELIKLGRKDLIGRFLLTPREFRGLRDRDELLHFLAAFDDASVMMYPPRSEISYTEFFFPLAWQSGWRLVQEVDRFWGALVIVAARSERTAENLGMNWVAGALRNFVFHHAAQDSYGFEGTDEAWLDAVECSGFEASLI